jgi:hypothetical protein
MNGVCDLSSSKAALPVQKYVEEYSIQTKTDDAILLTAKVAR